MKFIEFMILIKIQYQYKKGIFMRLIYALLLLISYSAVSAPAHLSTVTVSTGLGGTVEVSTGGTNTPLRPHLNTVAHKILEHGGDKQLLKKIPSVIDVTIQNRKGQSVFLFGAIYSDLETIKFLNELDTSAAYLLDKQKRSPLLVGLRHKRPLAIIQFIHKLNPKALFEPDAYGNLPLHYAFRYKNSLEIIRFIFKMYPHALLTKRNDGKTPYDLMKKYMPNLTMAQLHSRSNRNISRNKKRNQGTMRKQNQCQQTLSLQRR